MKKLLFPLLSIGAFCIGNSILFTLLAVSLDKAGVSVNMIGAMTSAYFIGIGIGIFALNKIIIKVGHIRAFAGFTAGIIIIFITHGLIFDTYLWMVLRLLAGILIGGILLTIESWMISISNHDNRGSILASYMVALYLGYIIGQLCFELSLTPMKLFSLAAISCAVAIIPLTVANVSQPQLSQPEILSWRTLFQASKVGLFTALSSGLIMSVVYGLLPIFFLQKIQQTMGSVGSYMATVFIGGMVLQYPLGKLSDRISRPLLLIAIYFLLIFSSLSMMFLFKVQIVAYLNLFLFGGLAFTLYPVSVSHTCEKLNDGQQLPGSQSLLLLYSTGAMAGPLIAPFFIKYLGDDGLFIYFILISVLLALFILFVYHQREFKKPEEPHIAIPVGTTHLVTQIETQPD